MEHTCTCTQAALNRIQRCGRAVGTTGRIPTLASDHAGCRAYTEGMESVCSPDGDEVPALCLSLTKRQRASFANVQGGLESRRSCCVMTLRLDFTACSLSLRHTCSGTGPKCRPKDQHFLPSCQLPLPPHVTPSIRTVLLSSFAAESHSFLLAAFCSPPTAPRSLWQGRHRRSGMEEGTVR